jgi:prevent-host-death family protein
MSLTLSLPPLAEQDADRLAEVAAHAERDKERVVLTRDGKPVAAVVPIEDLEALEAEDEYWSRVADEAIVEWEAAGRPAGIPIEDIARDLGVDLTADPDAAP